LKAKRQESGAPPVSEEAKVANADKTFGKHMQEEAAQEFIEGSGPNTIAEANSIRRSCGDIVPHLSPEAQLKQREKKPMHKRFFPEGNDRKKRPYLQGT
jgi:hypothetical protein